MLLTHALAAPALQRQAYAAGCLCERVSTAQAALLVGMQLHCACVVRRGRWALVPPQHRCKGVAAAATITPTNSGHRLAHALVMPWLSRALWGRSGAAASMHMHEQTWLLRCCLAAIR